MRDLLMKDLRFALRSLRRRPGFTATVVLTLALGIGANSAIFSVVNGILLNALPFSQPERLVSLWPDGVWQRGGFATLVDGDEVYEKLAGYSLPKRFSLTGRDEPLRLDGVEVTADFFSTLGARPLHGRLLQAGDDRPGADRLVVLGHDLFQQQFNAEPSVVGQTIRLDGVERVVIGVMPADFHFPAPETELWIPATMDLSATGQYWGSGGSLEVIGRLRDGVTLQQANSMLSGAMPKVRAAYPWPMPEDYGNAATVVPLRERITGNVRSALWILMVSVGFVLLIGCVNVANLMLVRAGSRSTELALRAAVGAGRGRLMAQMLTESTLLALAGGALGLLLGTLGVSKLRAWLPADVPRADAIHLDGQVLMFTLAMALMTGAIFGLLPALRASRPDLIGSLKESRSGSDSRRLSHVLVAGQVAITVVLAVGAGLLLRSFQKQQEVDPGFKTDSVLTARVAPPEFRYDNETARRHLYGEIVSRLEALPGVETAAVSSQMPFAGEIFGSVFLIEGRPEPRGDAWPFADLHAVVSSGFLGALELPLVAGQWFDGSEQADSQSVVVISRTLAERHWPGESAVGKRISFPGRTPRWMTILGVVDDVKLGSLTEGPKGALYQPLGQGATGPMVVVTRAKGDPSALAGTLRGTISTIDGDTPISEVHPLAELVAGSLKRSRFIMFLLGSFALLALALAAVGIYGVTAYSVSQQQREMATRLALGADPQILLRWVVRRGLLLGAVGVAIGLPLAFATTRLLGTQLYRVSVSDPATFAVAALLLAAVAAVASYIPARRVLRTNPMLVLRAE